MKAHVVAMCLALLAVVERAEAQEAQAVAPVWQPPAPIVPTSGAGRAILPPSPPVRPAPPDRRLATSDLVLGMGIIFAPTISSTFDTTLSERGITPNLLWGLDGRMSHRAWNWLWIGGSAGFRRRSYASEGPSVNAHGVDLKLELEGRFPVGSNFEFTPHVGVGASYAAVSYNSVTDGGIAPRFAMGLSISMWMAGDVRFAMRLDYDSYPTHALNAAGDTALCR